MNIKYSLIIIVIVIIVGLVGFSVVKNFQSQTGETEIQNNMKTPKMEIDTNKKYSVVLHTEKGDITIELTAKKTPITVNNFVTLAKKGFYNNTIFHRVIKGFMIQGGDPKGDGTGGPGYQFDDEYFEGEYTRGTVAMANAGPDTNGSQFFIMHADNPLPKDYIIFGKVTSGMDVVDTIAESPVQANFSGETSTPITPIKILTIDVK
jgi:peptidylprolyl isomerase